jgi:ribose 5-phosphate isomerase RpiB
MEAKTFLKSSVNTGNIWEETGMRIAVVNEVSASNKNMDIIEAIHSAARDTQILNVGMKHPEEQPQLTYIHTGYISAILLNAGLCDLVVGGCGTGQGYLNSVMQFPNVFCGLVADPLDAWLFSQINAGNCISLALNRGYGWAADINLKYLFEKLFCDNAGGGYPVTRAESQKESRKALKEMSARAHAPMADILKRTPEEILETLSRQTAFMDVLREAGDNKMAGEITGIITGSAGNAKAGGAR